MLFFFRHGMVIQGKLIPVNPMPSEQQNAFSRLQVGEKVLAYLDADDPCLVHFFFNHREFLHGQSCCLEYRLKFTFVIQVC